MDLVVTAAIAGALTLPVAVAIAAKQGALPGTEGYHLKGLESKDKKRRSLAALALGKTAKAESAPALCAALKHPDPQTREAVLSALKKIGRPAIDPLCALLTERDADIKRVAVEGLISLGDKVAESAARKLRDGSSLSRAELSDVLAHIGPLAVESILKNCTLPVRIQDDQEDPDSKSRYSAFVDTLARAGATEPDEIYRFSAIDDKSRVVAGVALCRLDDPRGAQLLAQAFSHPHPDVWRVAYDEIISQGERAVPLLSPLLVNQDAAIRRKAEDALVRIGLPAEAALTEWLKHDRIEFRYVGARVLARIGLWRPLVAVMWPRQAPRVIQAIEKATNVPFESLSTLGSMIKAIEAAQQYGKMSRRTRGRHYLQSLLAIAYLPMASIRTAPNGEPYLALAHSMYTHGGPIRLSRFHPIARRFLPHAD